MRIGLIDSGMGGLNVLKELLKKYPNNSYIYYGDTKNLPYGNKTKEQLEILVDKAIDFLNKKEVDLIIFACGTISTVLNEKINNKIIDIMTPTIEYVNKNYSEIGLIATSATIKSNYFQNHINCNVKALETPLLVPMIESNNIDEAIINKYLKNFKNETIILGCTHYPLIKKYIKNNTIDMGEILVNSLKLTNEGTKEVELYFTEIDEKLPIKIINILKENYNIKKVG